MKKTWSGSAPSNIALIKYMGKTGERSSGAAARGEATNLPTNRSLSFTLEGFCTYVELETSPESADIWAPLIDEERLGEGRTPLALSEKGRTRFLAHLARLKQKWDYTGSFIVRSANDFPADCGLASSASSFAALTRVACQALAELTGRASLSEREMADLSRLGSGSSCRSFFSPWSLWDVDGAGEIDLPFGDLVHQAILVEAGQKTVSSSEAHRRVAGSALFQGRPERAELRLTALVQALRSGDWIDARDLCWAEFWDMHALFETCAPPFGYMTPGSLEVLDFVRHELWSQPSGGPIVTMDAGANVHLLHRKEATRDVEMVRTRFAHRFGVMSGNRTGSATGIISR